MTRKGVLQKAVVGMILLLIGLAAVVVRYIEYRELFLLGNFFAFLIEVLLWWVLGAALISPASILLKNVFVDWWTKRAFERAFDVALPSWRRDINTIQVMKRGLARAAVAKVLRQAKAEFQEAADEEKRFKEGPEETKRTLAATTQRKKATYFGRLKLAKKCEISVPKEVARLKPAAAEVNKAAVR